MRTFLQTVVVLVLVGCLLAADLTVSGRVFVKGWKPGQREPPGRIENAPEGRAYLRDDLARQI